MFREALLESAPVMPRRSAWPMATAFTMELILASVLVLLPLIYTGILPLSSRPPLLVPTQYAAPAAAQHAVRTSTVASANAMVFQRPNVVEVSYGKPLLGEKLKPGDDQPPVGPWQPGEEIGVKGATPTNLFTNVHPVAPKPSPRLIISNPSEAMLLNKVIPEYPLVAKLAGVQGDVKLHAIIAKDGTIQSLIVTSGPEMLRQSALNAVQQWRYRPYTLNGDPVEVETVITVSFHRF